MIAGAATCLAGAARGKLGILLSPGRIRALFRNPALGQPQAFAENASEEERARVIGPLPDLHRLFPPAGKFRDVYLRDHARDSGRLPFPGRRKYASPHIVLLRGDDAPAMTAGGAGPWAAVRLTLRNREITVPLPGLLEETRPVRVRLLLPAGASSSHYRASLDEWWDRRHAGRLNLVVRVAAGSPGGRENPGP